MNSKDMVIGAVVGVAVSVGIFLAMHSRQENVPVSTSMINGSTTLGLQTYTSQACGFSVDYPSDWVVNTVNDTSLVLMSHEEFTGEQTARANGVMFESYGYTASAGCAMSLKDYANQTGDEDFKSGDSIMTVLSANDQQVKKIEFEDFDAYEVIIGGLGVIDRIVIDDNGHIYDLSFPDVQDIDHLDADKKAILESFRLTK